MEKEREKKRGKTEEETKVSKKNGKKDGKSISSVRLFGPRGRVAVLVTLGRDISH